MPQMGLCVFYCTKKIISLTTTFDCMKWKISVQTGSRLLMKHNKFGTKHRQQFAKCWARVSCLALCAKFVALLLGVIYLDLLRAFYTSIRSALDVLHFIATSIVTLFGFSFIQRSIDYWHMYRRLLFHIKLHFVFLFQPSYFKRKSVPWPNIKHCWEYPKAKINAFFLWRFVGNMSQTSWFLWILPCPLKLCCHE